MRLAVSGSNQEIVATRLNLKQTMPLQATAFALCEDLTRIVAQNRVSVDELQVSITILSDPNMHGTVADPDLSGIPKGERAILVAEGNRKAWVFDDDKTPQELLDEAVRLCEPGEPALTLVMSLRADSSRSRGQVVDRPQAISRQEVRPPAVAGTFYPGSQEEIDRWLDEHLPTDKPRSTYSAAMVPHAGWTYSGKIAAEVLSQIEFPKTVIIIGPKHTPLGVDWAVAPHAKWSLPGGELDSDPELVKILAERIPGLELDALAHQKEHGIEVELPMIRRLAPRAKVVGIALAGGTLEKLGEFAECLAEVIREMPEPPLLLISSDMNHFASDTETRRLDEMALVELDKLDPDGLFRTTTEHHISMCGMRPAVVILKTLKALGGLTEAERTGYATSADVTGEKSRVVGYAGMLFR
jgi:AmmeMemoRadiSam system protein B